jgi:hypothetical protein
MICLGEYMNDRSGFLIQGERARLFPVLAETSKEGRTLSIVLACMETIEDFGKALLSDLGIKVGARTRLEAYTEVVLRKGGDAKSRPDGLLVVRNRCAADNLQSVRATADPSSGRD